MKKILSDDATPPVGGEAPIDIAAALAKGGVQTTGEDEGVTIPAITTEVTKPKEETPAPTEPAKVESPAPVKEEAPPVSPTPSFTAPAAEQPPVLNWRDELKKAEQAEILKELGYDEKMIGFFNTWRSGGDISEYVKAVSIDYAKMTPELLLKQQLFEEYPEFSPEDLEELYRARVIDHYKLNPDEFSEAEVKRGRLLLAADAKKVREQMVARQKEYILTAKPPEQVDYRKEMEAAAKQTEADNKQALDNYKASLYNHPATKELLSNKKLALGEGEEVVNYEIADPNKLLSVLQNPVEWAHHVFNEDGTPMVDKQLALGAVVTDHKAFIREIFKAGKAVGQKMVMEEIENAKKPAAQSPTPEVPLTPAQALAKNGVLTYG